MERCLALLVYRSNINFLLYCSADCLWRNILNLRCLWGHTDIQRRPARGWFKSPRLTHQQMSWQHAHNNFAIIKTITDSRFFIVFKSKRTENSNRHMHSFRRFPFQTFDDGEMEGLPSLLNINPMSLDIPFSEVMTIFGILLNVHVESPSFKG